MSPEGYSQRSSCDPFIATQAQRAPTLFPPPGAWGGGGARPMGEGVYLFAYLLVVPTCLGKEDHLLGYHPKVLDLQRPPPFREGRDLNRGVPAM